MFVAFSLNDKRELSQLATGAGSIMHGGGTSCHGCAACVSRASWNCTHCHPWAKPSWFQQLECLAHVWNTTQGFTGDIFTREILTWLLFCQLLFPVQQKVFPFETLWDCAPANVLIFFYLKKTPATYLCSKNSPHPAFRESTWQRITSYINRPIIATFQTM